MLWLRPIHTSASLLSPRASIECLRRSVHPPCAPSVSEVQRSTAQSKEWGTWPDLAARASSSAWSVPNHRHCMGYGLARPRPATQTRKIYRSLLSRTRQVQSRRHPATCTPQRLRASDISPDPPDTYTSQSHNASINITDRRGYDRGRRRSGCGRSRYAHARAQCPLTSNPTSTFTQHSL